MTAIDPESLNEDAAKEAQKEAKRERLFTRINAADKWFQVLGLSWISPVL
ncbi:MAG: ABC transporter permease, partial [Pseudomonadota bacterium]